ncbi:MAG TPA: GNAT family protein [Chitinophagaceae bacterium]|nr:GNAT family protein [Chitinophagaceae bacterium]HNF71673.1 GNAT family protein [Chitinophagaceae bacterium]
MSETIVLETPRLYLRAYPAEQMHWLFSQSDDVILHYLDLENQEEVDIEKKKYQGGYTTYRSSVFGFHLISRESGRLLGTSGFHNWFAEHQRAELGYMLRRESDRAQGYMKEALELIIPFGFEHLNLSRMEAFANPDNTPSIRLLEHFGFTREGLLKNHFMRGGIAEDSAVYALFRNDFPDRLV